MLKMGMKRIKGFDHRLVESGRSIPITVKRTVCTAQLHKVVVAYKSM